MRPTHTTNSDGGFTIIEVVLVLAIAGLIFLMVFLALPALQRTQRDTQRKNDLARFMSQVNAYRSNNQSQLPSTANNSQATWNTAIIMNYLTNSGQAFADPQNGTYTVSSVTTTLPSAVPTPTAGQIIVYINAKCGGANGVQAGNGSNSFAAVTFLEQGGYYCANS